MARTGKLTILQLWTCVTDDGRFLDLMEFELELASAGSPINGMQYRKEN
jgi:hypothetical protein